MGEKRISSRESFGRRLKDVLGDSFRGGDNVRLPKALRVERPRAYAFGENLPLTERGKPADWCADDADVENLIFELKRVGYVPIVTVEYELRARLSTVRLLSKGRSSLRKLRHRIRNRPPSHNRLSNSGNEP